MMVALAALFVSLGGGAYAAVSVPKRSIGTAQLKRGAVTNRKLHRGAVTAGKVKAHSLRATDFAAGQLPQGQTGATGPAGRTGPRGPKGETGKTGPAGISDYQELVFPEIVQPTDTSGEWEESCPPGTDILGGGVATFNKNIQIQASTPLDDKTEWSVSVVPLTGTNFGGGAGGSAVNIRITCAKVSS
jgi:hypothetical protein